MWSGIGGVKDVRQDVFLLMADPVDSAELQQGRPKAQPGAGRTPSLFTGQACPSDQLKTSPEHGLSLHIAQVSIFNEKVTVISRSKKPPH